MRKQEEGEEEGEKNEVMKYRWKFRRIVESMKEAEGQVWDERMSGGKGRTRQRTVRDAGSLFCDYVAI